MITADLSFVTKSYSRAIWHGFLDFIYPRVCSSCGEVDLPLDGRTICERCRQELRFLEEPLCATCGTPLLTIDPATEPRCGRCLQGEFIFSSARSLYQYQANNVISDLLLKLKYRNYPELAKELGDVMASHCRTMFPKSNWHLIIPVPLHPKRLRQRGYNQAGLLAARVARRLRLPVREKLLRRIRHTPPQKGNRASRLVNLRHAFRVSNNKVVCGRNILLVDDVMTTGATVNSCAKILIQAGAGSIDVYTLARAAWR